jgi:hypothetical protein
MKYEIYVQGTLYKTVETDASFGEVLAETIKDREDGKITGYDATKDANIEVKTVA